MAFASQLQIVPASLCNLIRIKMQYLVNIFSEKKVKRLGCKPIHLYFIQLCKFEKHLHN